MINQNHTRVNQLRRFRRPRSRLRLSTPHFTLFRLNIFSMKLILDVSLLKTEKKRGSTIV